MENANLSFIHPEKQVDIYGGLALLALATGGLFTRFESVKIVTMTTFHLKLLLVKCSIKKASKWGPLDTNSS